jgi:hypothetical protein
VLENDWLKTDRRSSIQVFMIWSSQKGAQEKNVSAATRLIPDRRVRDYWDGSDEVGTAFASVFRSSEPVWDVWMVFRPGVLWKRSPPTPTWWEDQIGLRGGRELDPKRFARKVGAISTAG